MSRALADRYWPGQEAIGQSIRFPVEAEARTVVGIVEDIRVSSLTGDRAGAIYVPIGQFPTPTMRVIARTSTPADEMGELFRAAVAVIDSDTPISDLRSLDSAMARSVSTTRGGTIVLGSFAATALLLGAMGIYGLASFTAGQRRREFAIRTALGAGRAEVRRLVLREGARVVGIGMAAGMVASLASNRILAGMLHAVSGSDPMVFSGAILVLALAAFAALYLPARRAARSRPAEVMRGS